MYRVGGILIAAALFVAFVPGVLVTLPKGGSKWTILLVHGILFAIVTHYAMKYYHRNVVFREGFGNYGPTCPNGHVMGEDSVCRPVGYPTASASTGFRMEGEP